jgi:hypothetical protein
MTDFQSPPSKLQKERILDSARQQILSWAKAQFATYADRLQEHFFNLADKAGNNEAQARYFHARDEIKRHQQTTGQLYLQHINDAFDNYRDHRATVSDPRLDSLPHQHSTRSGQDASTLSLVDNDQLEEQLAVTSMCRKITSASSESLYALNQRFSVLLHGAKINDLKNPVAPGVFAEALQTAIAALNLDSRIKLIIYKVFETACVADLEKLYALLNHHFQSSGVLPHIAHTIRKNPSGQSTEPLPEELINLSSAASVAKQIELFHAIHLLITRLHPPVARPSPAIPAEHILASIQQLQLHTGQLLSQLDTPQAVANTDIASLRAQATQQANSTANADTGVVEIVGLLFEYMLDDRQLPNAVKTLLSYLHTPFLKIALLDQDFFNHPEHPARQLLNSLVAAGERWVEPNGKYKSDVFQQIKTIVQRLLKEFDNDVRLFSELAFEFNHYLRQHAHRTRLAEKRAIQAAQGENKLKEIRQKINSYLKKKVSDQPLPAAIQTLLFEPWANFLAFNLLRFGSRSDQWQQAAQIVDDVLWYCQPHRVETDMHARQRREELKTSLPAALQAGFETVGYDHAQSRRLLTALQQASIAGNTSTDSFATPAPSRLIDDVDIAKPLNTAAKNDPLLLKLKHTPFGTWFEFDANSETPQRVKLLWSNTNTLHFLFVNRLGQQVAIKTGEQLASDIRSGDIKVHSALKHTPFFEKAMERILQQIKQRQEKTQG